MIKISEVVEEILKEDDLAQAAAKSNILNYSEYARIILPEVEKRTFKPVKVKSIVVTLSRLINELKKDNLKKDPLKILNISVHSGLEEVTFEKTTDNLERLKKIYSLVEESHESFFTSTISISEITIIGISKIMSKVYKEFKGVKPIFESKVLSGVTVKFSQDYLTEPNVIYELVKKVAAKNTNLIEIVSTTTELTFIIERKDTQKTVGQLSKLV